MASKIAKPNGPMSLEFEESMDDEGFPLSDVAASGNVEIYVYDAGHGFVSDRGADYHRDAARLARLRTLQLFARGSGRGEF